MAIIIIVGTIAAIIQHSPGQSPIVSHDELRDYFSAYLTEYSQLVEENMGLVNDLEIGSTSAGNWTLYWQRPFAVQGIISKVHGAALILNRSNREDIEIIDFDKSIEYYIWPSMAENIETLPSIRVLKASAYYLLDTQVTADGALMYIDPGADLMYTGQGHVFSFPKGTGAVIFFGSLLEDNRLILKGSNNKQDWSELQARFDSLSRFLWDGRDVLNGTSLQEIKSKYMLPLQLEKISIRMSDGSYKGNPSLFTEDYSQLQTVCLSNETLTKVLNDYYTMQSKENPAITDQLVGFFVTWLWPIVAASAAGIIAGVILLYYEPRLKKQRKNS